MRKISLDLLMWLTTFLGNLSTQRRKVLSPNTKGKSSGMGSPLKGLYKEKGIFWLKLFQTYWSSQTESIAKIKGQINTLYCNVGHNSNIMTTDDQMKAMYQENCFVC